MLSMYPACFYKEDDGYSVIFPDLNYLATQGDSFEDAMEMAVECLASYLYIAQRDGEDVPAPSSLVNIDPVAVAKELDPDLPVGEAIVNLVSVDVAEYAKKHFEKSVKKTLSIPAWLNEAAVAQGVNFSQVLQRALKEQLHMAYNIRKPSDARCRGLGALCRVAGVLRPAGATRSKGLGCGPTSSCKARGLCAYKSPACGVCDGPAAHCVLRPDFHRYSTATTSGGFSGWQS